MACSSTSPKQPVFSVEACICAGGSDNDAFEDVTLDGDVDHSESGCASNCGHHNTIINSENVIPTNNVSNNANYHVSCHSDATTRNDVSETAAEENASFDLMVTAGNTLRNAIAPPQR